MIESWLEYWVKNIHRLNEGEIKRECGVKPYGIEYRIMLDGGVANCGSPVMQDKLLSDIDLAWNRLRLSHPDEMTAVKEYYKRGSYRAVRLLLGVGTVRSRSLVKDGELLITGALMMLI